MAGDPMSGTFVENHGLCLRAVEERDLDWIRALRNDQDTWVWLTDPRPLSAADEKGWYASIGVRSGRLYLVAHDADHPFIGLVRMDEHDPVNRSIRVGADISPALRGLGFGRSVFGTVLKYCFDHLNIHRVWLAVLETNARAIRLYKGQRLKEEGRWREAVFRGGKYVDYLLMSILEGEFRAGR